MIALLAVTSTQVMARPSLSQMDQKLDALVVCSPGTPTRFVDNGDSTICDSETGLMWEMKNASDGVVNLNNPRDVDNRYPLTIVAAFAPGTAFVNFLPRLNGEIASHANSEQLGLYNDWRLPTKAELRGILDCSFDSCIDPVFGPMNTSLPYWTSTSRTSTSNDAWTIRFGFVGFDFVGLRSKSTPYHVRAVRGGR